MIVLSAKDLAVGYEGKSVLRNVSLRLETISVLLEKMVRERPLCLEQSWGSFLLFQVN